MNASEGSAFALKPKTDIPRRRNRGISNPTKKTDVLTKFYKKGSGITYIEAKA